MKIASEYSRRFHSDGLTKRKFSMLKEHANSLLSIRNEISILVNSDLMKYLSMSKIDFQKSILPLIKDRVHSNFTKQLCDDVYSKYQNRFSAVLPKIRFDKVKSIEVIKYKVNTKKNKKGDIKSIVRHTESTPLSKTLTYLARYGNVGSLEYINNALVNEVNDSKKMFYEQVLGIIELHGFDRLLKLAMMKRERVLTRYAEPIVFNSMTFRGRSRLSTDIVSYNRNFNSIIKAFVCFGWTETRSSFKIPVKYSKKFHGNMEQYTNGTDTSYIVKFNSNKSVQVILSHEGDRELPDADRCTSYVGFDANSKHNQLTASNGITVDYDRILLDDLFNELKKIDQLKSINKDYKPSTRRTVKIETLRRKMIHHTERNCSNICKSMVANGDNHAVFEDLDNSFSRTFAKNEDDINYNRLINEMHLSSIKDEFEHIARKHGIAVSTVHPEYTSQECSKCHCIDDANRQTQEKFVCVQCGHTDNADTNASLNIKRRVSNAVLRDKLLIRSKLGNGSYSPRTVKRFKVKEMLLSLRYNLSILDKREPITSTGW